MSDVTVTTDPPMGNTPEARTSDGTLRDVSPAQTTQPSSTTTQTQTKETQTESDGTTFLTGKKTEPAKVEGETKPEVKPETKPEAPVVPEKYADFKLPDGYEFDPKARTSFETTAKELGLTQEGAQKLIDIWSEHAAASAKAPYDLWATTQQQWHDQILERFGGETGAAKLSADVNKVINTTLPPSLQKSFRAALDFTGAGSNPDILEAFSIMLKPHMEGKPVAIGTVPNRGERGEPITSQPQAIDPAAAMYPHLVKNRPTQ